MIEILSVHTRLVPPPPGSTLKLGGGAARHILDNWCDERGVPVTPRTRSVQAQGPGLTPCLWPWNLPGGYLKMEAPWTAESSRDPVPKGLLGQQ